VREIRWHGRGGQGAKTASQVMALAMLRTGRQVQAFPEYGPERSGAPMQAYTRVDDRPIRRRCAVTSPGVVVVLDPTLAGEPFVAAGLEPGSLAVVSSEASEAELRELIGHGCEVVPVPGRELATLAGTEFASMVMLGALAAAIGEPPLHALEEATRELLGEKLGSRALATSLEAVAKGYRYVEERREAPCLG
jgi:pyruvate ferredoxin oxidoreductase gamma subunit